MPSLKDVKTKIAGVGKTKQITKAMNMVASAKLRGAQSRIERFRAYADEFQAILSDLASKADGASHPLLEVRNMPKSTLIVLVTSDRGLCGGFNANLIAAALKLAKTAESSGKSVTFVTIGKKGRDAVAKSGRNIRNAYVDALGAFDFSLSAGIGKEIVSEYISGAADEVILVYGRFESVSKQVPTVLQLLPVTATDETLAQVRSVTSDYIYEPDVNTILGALLPRFVNVQIHRGLLDTSAAENAARMMAMDNATRNCDELTQSLTLLYNKTRQATITSELIDIVGGAEALQ